MKLSELYAGAAYLAAICIVRQLQLRPGEASRERWSEARDLAADGLATSRYETSKAQWAVHNSFLTYVLDANAEWLIDERPDPELDPYQAELYRLVADRAGKDAFGIISPAHFDLSFLPQ